jgi:hypothetical protein
MDNNISKGLENAIRNGKFSPPDWKGKRHSEETIKKMKRDRKGKGKGSKNSQYGTMWITNDIDNRKIKKDEEIPLGWKQGRKIVYK